MDTFGTLTNSIDKLFITTIQNILGSDIKVCKWNFIFTSFGVGLGLFINSFYFFKIHNENKLIQTKLDLLLNNQKVIIEGNITIYDHIKNNMKALEITLHDKNIHLEEIKKDNDVEYKGFDLLYYE